MSLSLSKPGSDVFVSGACDATAWRPAHASLAFDAHCSRATHGFVALALQAWWRAVATTRPECGDAESAESPLREPARPRVG